MHASRRDANASLLSMRMCCVMDAYVYILRCSDGSYYTGSTRSTLENRLAQHDSGALGGYTAKRRPVVLVWHQHFSQISDAVSVERRIKGWSRAKKEALIRGDFKGLKQLAKRTRHTPEPHPEEARQRRLEG